uniref:ShKT domain-containing protein n=1 Tax=Strongyloides venezuelensis TaxID=75913 RepID=A0A0K0FJC9_STRVS
MKFITILAVLFLTIPMEVNGADCATMATKGYCVNSMYRATMCKSCTTQCDARGGDDACTLPIKTSACSDVATNCASLAYLCTNSLYKNLLAQKCSSTCNTCNGVPATTTTTTGTTTTAGTTTTVGTTTTTTKDAATTLETTGST